MGCGGHRPGELCTAAVTVAEIRYALERLADGRHKQSLLAAATEVFAAFSDYIQPFDADAAIWYASIVVRRDRLGLPIDGFDAQIAAICRTRGAALATDRDVHHRREAHYPPTRGQEIIGAGQFRHADRGVLRRLALVTGR